MNVFNLVFLVFNSGVHENIIYFDRNMIATLFAIIALNFLLSHHCEKSGMTICMYA